MNVLSCIYTCGKDAEYDYQIKSTDWYLNNTQCKVFVTCDQNIPRNYIYDPKNETMVLNTKESYSNLAVKTFKMIESCVKEFDFDFLVKVDSTLINYRNQTQQFHLWSTFEKFFNDTKSYSKEYNGVKRWHRFQINEAMLWSQHQGMLPVQRKMVDIFRGNVPFEARCGKWYNTKFPGYFSGKSYLISRKFSEYIVDEGKVICDRFVDAKFPTEDVYIGNM